MLCCDVIWPGRQGSNKLPRFRQGSRWAQYIVDITDQDPGWFQVLPVIFCFLNRISAAEQAVQNPTIIIQAVCSQPGCWAFTHNSSSQMPQTFVALQCAFCNAFQAQLDKKAKKFTCVLCNAKQSFR